MTQSLSRALLGAVAGLALSAGAASAQTTVKDMTGRTLTFDKPAERVITIPIPAASIAISLDGSTKKLIGMNSASKDAIVDSVLGEFFPDAKSIASNVNTTAAGGFAPNVEAIAALRPDLVVQWGDRGDDIVAPLTNAGIRTGLILYGDEKQARDMIAFTGETLGAKGKIAQLNDWRDKTTAAVKAKLAGVTTKPKVLYLLRAKASLTVSGVNTYNDYYINLAGGTNAAAEINGQKPVNKEQIAAWNPDVILLNNFEGDLETSIILNDPILSQTSAGRGKRVYRMPMGGYRWDPPSQELPMSWMWVFNVVHPEAAPFDVRSEIKTWYPILYSHQISEAQIDKVLLTSVNKGSAGYDRFAAK